MSGHYILSLLLSLLYLSYATGSSLAVSYRDSSIALLASANQVITDHWDYFKPTSLPSDKEPATLRVDILLLYNQMNFFVYSLPLQTPGTDKDLFFVITNVALKVYIALGDFKDLMFVPYTPEDLKERVTAVELAMKEWVHLDAMTSFAEYFASSSDQSQIRDKSLLSPFWWQAVPLVPVNTAPVSYALNDICRGIFLVLIENYHPLLSIPDELYEKSEYYDYAHMYRFTIRSIVTIYSVFRNIQPVEPCEKEGMSEMMTIHGRLGNVNDLVVSYLYYISEGDESKAIEVATKIRELWPVVKREIHNMHWNYKITCLISALAK